MLGGLGSIADRPCISHARAQHVEFAHAEHVEFARAEHVEFARAEQADALSRRRSMPYRAWVRCVIAMRVDFAREVRIELRLADGTHFAASSVAAFTRVEAWPHLLVGSISSLVVASISSLRLHNMRVPYRACGRCVKVSAVRGCAGHADRVAIG
jgi:hypothetical protein